MSSRIWIVFLLQVVAILAWQEAPAQDFPSRLIHVVVPNSPGTGQDLIGRLLATEMAKTMGQSLVIDNRPGAGGNVGAEYVSKRAPKDGYTILMGTSTTMAVSMLTEKNLSFDPTKDLVPVLNIGEIPLLFGSMATLPWKSFTELVQHAKANPSKLNYGAASPVTQILTDGLLRKAGMNVTYIPYGSSAPFNRGLITGEVHMGLVSEVVVNTLADRFRVLAVTGKRRLQNYSDVPTFAELGYPEMAGASYILYAPAGTPNDALQHLAAAGVNALQSAEVKAGLARNGIEIAEDPSPAAATKRLSQELTFFAEVLKMTDAPGR